jgi:hypothetical protein
MSFVVLQDPKRQPDILDGITHLPGDVIPGEPPPPEEIARRFSAFARNHNARLAAAGSGFEVEVQPLERMAITILLGEGQQRIRRDRAGFILSFSPAFDWKAYQVALREDRKKAREMLRPFLERPVRKGSLEWVAQEFLGSLDTARIQADPARQAQGVASADMALIMAFEAGQDAQHMLDKLIADPTLKPIQARRARGHRKQAERAKAATQHERTAAQKMLDSDPDLSLDEVARRLAERSGARGKGTIRRSIVGLAGRMRPSR